MKIGRIKSLEKDDVWYLISRNGKAIKDGGKGVEWTCSCPYGRRQEPCKHLLFIFNNFIDLPRIDNFIFLRDGRKFFRNLYDSKIIKYSFLTSLLERQNENIK
jgi:hypothetical protein